MSSEFAITAEKQNKWRNEFLANPKNILAQNVCTRFDPFELCISRKKTEQSNHVFNLKVEAEGKPVTNQKSSGRCWIFAALNCIRIPFMKEYNLDEFEFSQSYLFYWDKIERCNLFLLNVWNAFRRGETADDRLVSFWLQDPINDGGQWDMLVNLILKYGLMPKKCFPESFSSESSARLSAILKSKLRESAKVINEMVLKNVPMDTISEFIADKQCQIHKIVSICLGMPSETFTWEYYDKNKAYKKVGPITPVDFYTTYVKPHFDVNEKVCLVNDPRTTVIYGQTYTIYGLGNVVEGRKIIYNNQPVDILMDLVVKSLQKNEPVWFGCEVNKRFVGKLGIEDLEIYDFQAMFDTDIQTVLPKSDRLVYGESAMTHAMLITAASVDDNGKPTKFRIENSWGEDRGEKGYIVMTRDWFKEFAFEVVVSKSIVPDEILKVFDKDPIVLPAWDPMGTLAK